MSEIKQELGQEYSGFEENKWLRYELGYQINENIKLNNQINKLDRELTLSKDIIGKDLMGIHQWENSILQETVKAEVRRVLQELYEYPHEYHEKKILEIAKRYGVEICDDLTHDPDSKIEKPKKIAQYKQPHCYHCEWYKEHTGTCIAKLMSWGLKSRAKACGCRNCSSFKPLDEYKDCYKELQK